MNKKVLKIINCVGIVLVALIYTVLVAKVDVKPIGPENSLVGFAKINRYFANLIGTNMLIYKITEYLGYLVVSFVLIYALIGLVELIKRKSIKKVDKELFILAGFYILVIGVYFLFEKVVINYRPVLMDGALDPSYPSSHTMLAFCICGSSILINNILFAKNKLAKAFSIVCYCLLFTITIGRFVSGVHWFSDILGGIIISLALLQILKTVIFMFSKKKFKITYLKDTILVAAFLVLAAGAIFLVRTPIFKKGSSALVESKKFNKDGIPYPEVTGGVRGELGIDKNVNEDTIDQYLGRDDSVYRDMRMLIDPAIYEKIGGNRFLNGYVKGFEVVPLPYIIPVDSLPSEVGETYTGRTLFSRNEDGSYVANYTNSMSFIEELFPKDKYIFLMCGGGGYAGMMKQFLVSMGWDEKKIWVVGGYWYYTGENKVEVPYDANKLTYDFSNVPYHEVTFVLNRTSDPNKVTLTSRYYDTNENEEFDSIMREYYDLPIDYDADGAYEIFLSAQKKEGEYINQLLEKKESFILVFHDYEDSCSDNLNLGFLAERSMEKLNIYIYRLDPGSYQHTSLYKKYHFIPGVLIVDKGIVTKYFDGNDDFTLEIKKAYENETDDELDLFIGWLQKYVNL